MLYRWGGVVKHLRHFRGDANIRFRSARRERSERKVSVVNRYSNDLFRRQRAPSTSKHPEQSVFNTEKCNLRTCTPHRMEVRGVPLGDGLMEKGFANGLACLRCCSGLHSSRQPKHVYRVGSEPEKAIYRQPIETYIEIGIRSLCDCQKIITTASTKKICRSIPTQPPWGRKRG